MRDVIADVRYLRGLREPLGFFDNRVFAAPPRDLEGDLARRCPKTNKKAAVPGQRG